MNCLFYPALAGLLVSPATLLAQTSTFSQQVGADTYVSSGQPNVNFGSQGAMEIAVPTAAQPRTQIALLRFDTAAMQASFNTDYGVGNWAVTGVTLSLFSNFPRAGVQPNNASYNKIATGGFEFDLLSNNTWSETAITWNTLPTILPAANNSNSLTPLGNFFWDATGAGSSTWTMAVGVPLTDAIVAGTQVTILGQPTTGSTVGYLFNTVPSNPGYLNVTVAAVPEPSILGTLVAGTALIICHRRKKRGWPVFARCRGDGKRRW